MRGVIPIALSSISLFLLISVYLSMKGVINLKEGIPYLLAMTSIWLLLIGASRIHGGR